MKETGITCDDVLRNIFEEKCSFSLTKREVQDIQHAVEIMVIFLLTSIYEQTPFRDFVCSNTKLIKLLTSVKNPHRIHETFRNENLLKVGSFYEDTKNCYPDEFDFICVIADCDVEDYIRMKDITYIMSDIFHKSLYDTIQNGLKFPVGSCLVFDQYICLHGPAASLKFKYRSVNDTSRCRSIFVDLSPACKVTIRNELPEEMTIPYSEWKDVILETGSFLVLKSFNGGHPKNETKTKISITESEKRFMQYKISDEHKRVYRLLKFIFNGGLLDDDLKRHIRDGENGPDIVCFHLFYPRIVYEFSSYIIKTLMFHHCHSCIRTMETTDKDCIIATLKHLLDMFEKEQNKFFLRKMIPCFETFFSVLVLTMTGEYIEIADRYRSSFKITDVLEKRVRSFKGRNYCSLQQDSSIQQLSEQIPIVNELRAIGHEDTENHVYGKIMINYRRQLCPFLSFVILVAFSSFLFMKLYTWARYLNSDSEYCFLGQGTADLTTFGKGGNVMLNFSQTLQTEEGRNISTHFLCLEQPFYLSDKTVAKMSWLYLCGYKQNCTVERSYHLKTVDYGKGQETFCDVYSFPEIMDHLMHSPGNENISMFGPHVSNARRALCVWEVSSCMNVTVRNVLGQDVRNEIVTCFEKGRGQCLHTFIQENNILDCYKVVRVITLAAFQYQALSIVERAVSSDSSCLRLKRELRMKQKYVVVTDIHASIQSLLQKLSK